MNSLCSARKRHAFTMIEFIVTLLIIGLIAAVAISSYQSYIRRSKMSEGYTGMNALVKQQTTFFINNREFMILSQNPSILPSSKHEVFESNTQWD